MNEPVAYMEIATRDYTPPPGQAYAHGWYKGAIFFHIDKPKERDGFEVVPLYREPPKS